MIFNLRLQFDFENLVLVGGFKNSISWNAAQCSIIGGIFKAKIKNFLWKNKPENYKYIKLDENFVN